MEVFQAVKVHLQYQRANSKKNSVKNCEYVLHRFVDKFFDRELETVTHEETFEFLTTLTEGNKQALSVIAMQFFLLVTIYSLFPHNRTSLTLVLLSSLRKFIGDHKLSSGKLLIKKPWMRSSSVR